MGPEGGGTRARRLIGPSPDPGTLMGCTGVIEIEYNANYGREEDCSLQVQKTGEVRRRETVVDGGLVCLGRQTSFGKILGKLF